MVTTHTVSDREVRSAAREAADTLALLRHVGGHAAANLRATSSDIRERISDELQRVADLSDLSLPGSTISETERRQALDVLRELAPLEAWLTDGGEGDASATAVTAAVEYTHAILGPDSANLFWNTFDERRTAVQQYGPDPDSAGYAAERWLMSGRRRRGHGLLFA